MKTRKIDIILPTEAQEQTAYFEWAKLAACKNKELAYAFAIPNGGSRNVVEARNLKLQGVKRGVPDICIPVKKGKYGALFIEMKRQKNGSLSKEQKEMINYLNDNGYKAVVTKGCQEAIEETIKYFNL